MDDATIHGALGLAIPRKQNVLSVAMCVLVAGAAWLPGCGADGDDSTGGAEATSLATSDSTTTSGAEQTTGQTSATATAATAATTGSTTGASSTGAGSDSDGSAFVMDPDGGGAANECDVWAQDCPDGEKCMPWANDGTGGWNATKCTPVDANPKQPGDPCTGTGGAASGHDDCDLASICWGQDEMGVGTCVGFCEGSEAAPTCSDPSMGCTIANDGVLILCLPSCNPLLQDCAEGSGCYVEPNGEFLCSPDYSGAMGASGDPCAYIEACDPGLFCANPDQVPDCAGDSGCCTEFCDTTAPNSCAGMAGGAECVPFFEDGQAPPGVENVGGCLIPA